MPIATIIVPKENSYVPGFPDLRSDRRCRKGSLGSVGDGISLPEMAFVAVALLSIIPTIQIIRWRRALTADAAFLPTAPDIAGVRRFLWAEVVCFAFIPAFVAAMARGYGVFTH